jgi:pimeloyl-ACP methyl ester carboxylesterase
MPHADNDGVALYYETRGGDADAGTVAFVGDVGFGAWQWAWQAPAVAGPFRALVFDHRGVGRSDAPPGPYSLSALAGDLEAVLADAGAARAHLVGAGLGGLVALALAPDSGRVRSLTLLGSGPGDGAHPGAAAAPPDDGAAVRASTERLLSAAFRRDRPAVVDRIVEWRAAEDAPERVWAAQAAAVADATLPPRYEVTTPTLVVHGGADGQWPVEEARALAADLPRGEFHAHEDAAHLVGVERSRPVNDRLVGHVESASSWTPES